MIESSIDCVAEEGSIWQGVLSRHPLAAGHDYPIASMVIELEKSYIDRFLAEMPGLRNSKIPNYSSYACHYG